MFYCILTDHLPLLRDEGDLLQTHLQRCDQCQARWKILDRLHPVMLPQGKCPEPHAFADYAIGTLKDEERDHLLDHALGCRLCAEKLRSALIQDKELPMVAELVEQAERALDGAHLLRRLLKELQESSRRASPMVWPVLRDRQTGDQVTLVPADRPDLQLQGEAPIRQTTALSLSWQGEEWGSILVEHISPGRLRVVEREGIFLAVDVPQDLVLQAAASTDEESEHSEQAIEIGCLPSGVSITMRPYREV